MRAALKALSYPEPDVTKTFPVERQIKSALGKPLFYKIWDHKIRLNGHEVPVRVFSPGTRGIHDYLLFFHGGGWVTGNIDSYTRTCDAMARLTNRTVISVDYRLAPENRFPDGLNDCYAVAREVYLNSSSLLGASPSQITMIGDSAGGNLAAAVSLMARDRGEFLPYHQILLYPATHYDHSESSPFASVRDNGTDYLLTSKRVCEYMSLYKNSDADFYNPYFSPLISSDLSNQPNTLIITAEFDPLRDEGEAYGAALFNAGVMSQVKRIPDALHGFISLPSHFAPVRLAYSLINRFLRDAHPSDCYPSSPHLIHEHHMTDIDSNNN